MRDGRRLVGGSFDCEREPNRLALRADGGDHPPIGGERPDDLQTATRKLGRLGRPHDRIAGTAVADRDANLIRRPLDGDGEVGAGMAHGVGRQLRDHHRDGIGGAGRDVVDDIEDEPAGLPHRGGIIREPALPVHRSA